MKKRTSKSEGKRFGQREWQEAATLFGTLKEKTGELEKASRDAEAEMATALREGRKAARDADRVLNGPGGEYQEEVERVVEEFVDALEE